VEYLVQSISWVEGGRWRVIPRLEDIPNSKKGPNHGLPGIGDYSYSIVYSNSNIVNMKTLVSFEDITR
jgi:hypothetical protein